LRETGICPDRGLAVAASLGRLKRSIFAAPLKPGVTREFEPAFPPGGGLVWGSKKFWKM
jgi:hypothetical protein